MCFAVCAARRAVGVMFSFLGAIEVYAFRDRVAVYPERGSRVANALFVPGVGFLNVELLEFFEGLVKPDVAVEHVFNHCFEARANLHRSDPNSVWGAEVRDPKHGSIPDSRLRTPAS